MGQQVPLAGVLDTSQTVAHIVSDGPERFRGRVGRATRRSLWIRQSMFSEGRASRLMARLVVLVDGQQDDRDDERHYGALPAPSRATREQMIPNE